MFAMLCRAKILIQKQSFLKQIDNFFQKFEFSELREKNRSNS